METRKLKNLTPQNEAMFRILEKLVIRIITVVQPFKIILFGAAARGMIDSNSDLNILVVMPDGTLRRQTARLFHPVLAGLGMAKDIIVVTESDLKAYCTNSSLIIEPAMAEGKELYRAVAKRYLNQL